MNHSPLEVVVLNDCASLTGGSSAVAIASAMGLARQGIPTTLFTAVGPVAPHLLKVPDLTVVCLGQAEIARNPRRLEAFRDGWRNGQAVHALRNLLATRSPARTVVHAHGWTKALSPCVLAAALDLGFPLVVTLHDFFISCPNGGFFVYPKNEICRRAPLSGACWRCNCDRRNRAQKLWRNARTWIQNGLLHVPERVSFFVGVSQFSLNLLKPFLPATTPTRVVRHPVDFPQTAPAAVAENRTFLYIGRLEVEKGARLFAEAARAAGVAATFVGDGALRLALEQAYPEFRFTGWLQPDEIRSFLRGCRALVFPPLWYETLGLVVIEAAAAGVPAIVSDGCAATDHIHDGVNGLRFAHGSVSSLRLRIEEVARNDGLVRRLGQAAHDWYWQQPWTTQNHVAELLDIYGGLTAIDGAPMQQKDSYESAGRI
jgi:glycosyltransferase involved in cell wall biosynthesis